MTLAQRSLEDIFLELTGETSSSKEDEGKNRGRKKKAPQAGQDGEVSAPPAADQDDKQPTQDKNDSREDA